MFFAIGLWSFNKSSLYTLAKQFYREREWEGGEGGRGYGEKVGGKENEEVELMKWGGFQGI